MRLLVYIAAVLSGPVDDEPAAGQAVGKSPEWVWLENDCLKVGVLRSHGGAVGWLSEAGSDRNVLNHYDHGRLIQQSYYGDSDGSQWADRAWRYNPVQGGSYRGRAAVVEELRSEQATLYCRTVPRHWASGDLLSDCRMEQWMTLQDSLLKIRFRFHYSGSRTHKPRHQETPAVFVAAELDTLVIPSDDSSFDAGLRRRKPGWPNEHLQIPARWVAWTDQTDFGLGICVPEAQEATCYRYRGGSGSDCSYIAPLRTFALTPGLEFEYTAWFTVGNVEQIGSRFRPITQTIR